MDRNQSSSNLLDTHNRLVADVLLRFRSLTMLATIQAHGEEKEVDPQSIAVTGMSMQMEFESLNTSVKDLLALSRRLKELWLFGRLGAEDEKAKVQAEKLEGDVVRCAELVNSIQAKRYGQLAEASGGKWEPLAVPMIAPAPAPAPVKTEASDPTVAEIAAPLASTPGGAPAP